MAIHRAILLAIRGSGNPSEKRRPETALRLGSTVDACDGRPKPLRVLNKCGRLDRITSAAVDWTPNGFATRPWSVVNKTA
jgi:hypothetical protein